MTPPLMKCGHAANGKDHQTGKPVCVICLGIHPGAEVIETNQPDFNGRKAQCFYCKQTRLSSLDLPFLMQHPEREFDEYYCGCKGWD